MPNPWEKYAAPVPDTSGPWSKYGAPPPAAPEETPGFGGRLAESFGIPSSQKQAEGVLADALQHPSELIPTPGHMATHLLRAYGNQVEQTWKEYKSQLDDITDRLAQGHIDKTEAAKQFANAVTIHAVKAIPLFGSTLFNYGQDIEQGNYAGAAGGGLGFAAQVAGPKALEATARVAGATPEAIRNYTPSGDIPELVKRTVLGQTVGRLPATSLLETLTGSKVLARPTLAEWWKALQPDKQMSLFKSMPKLGDTPISPQTHPATFSLLQETAAPSTAEAAAPATAKPFQAGGSTVPRVSSGEAVINDALTSLDKPTLMRIAKSRGIDTTTEANLIPSKAEASLVKKIGNDMTLDELADARDVGLEVSRNKPVPGQDLGKKAMQEAWHYKVVKQFFPDVDLPQALERRAQATIAKRPTTDYTPIYRAAAQKASPPDATDAEIKAKATDLQAQDENMEALLRESITQAQAKTEATATAEGRSAQAEAARAGSKYMNPSPAGFGQGVGVENTEEGARLIRERAEREVKRKGTLGEMR